MHAPCRTRSIHAGGKLLECFSWPPARRRAARVGVCAQPDEGRVPRRFGRAGGALRVGRSLGDGWIDVWASYDSQNRPHALAPHRRKLRERFGRHARAAACCVRGALLRWPAFAVSWPAQASRADIDVIG